MRLPIGVLLGQVGTPEAPTPGAVRRYLARFLSDPRVVDYSPWIWQPLLRGVILPLRGRRSARLYKRIWTEDGSPLLVESQKQRAALQAALGDDYRVALGMAYKGPSFHAAVDELLAAGVQRIILFPMFPQYSSSTTASIYDGVFEAATGRAGWFGNRQRRFVPAIDVVSPCFEDPAYIAALAARVRLAQAGAAAPPDHLVVTFHGLPERYISTGDPYRGQCEVTAHLLIQALDWPRDKWTLCFQSRFGREPWIEPETAGTLKQLAGRGIKRPLVIAPGFTTDCLETLDELGNEGRDEFEQGGGDGHTYFLSPCLNDLPEWIETMATLVRRKTPPPEM